MKTDLIQGTERPDPSVLIRMREQAKPGTRWAAYQNHDLGHHHLGHLRFLAVGPNNTLKQAPWRHPDLPNESPLWRYLLVGFVDLTTGKIE